MLSTLGGVLLTVLLIVLAASVGGKRRATSLPQPSPQPVKGHAPWSGRARASLAGFSLRDPEGYTVLKIRELGVDLKLSELSRDASQVRDLRIEGVTMLLRRGSSGRVSLADALGTEKRAEPPRKPEGRALNVGPVAVSDVDLTVAMGARPVVIHLDRAWVSVHQRPEDAAPRIFLSRFVGHLVEPDPLPASILIDGGEGVVDLSERPLVDVRVRVCIGTEPLPLRIELKRRKEQVELTVDAEGLVATSTLAALKMVATFKSDKLAVHNGRVPLPDEPSCNDRRGASVFGIRRAKAAAEATDDR